MEDFAREVRDNFIKSTRDFVNLLIAHARCRSAEGISVPVVGIAWLSAELFGSRGTTFLTQSARAEVDRLRSLLPRITKVRLTSNAWPTPPSSHLKRARWKRGWQLYLREKQNDEAEPPLDEAVLSYILDLSTSPTVDMRCFPSCEVLLLHRVGPDRLTNMSVVRQTLRVFRVEQAPVQSLASLFAAEIALSTGQTNRSFDTVDPLSSCTSRSSHFPLEAFENLTHLKVSYGGLSGTRKPTGQHENLVIKVPNLESLCLSHNLLKSPRLLVEMSRLPFLLKLDLSHNKLSTFKHLEDRLPNLQQLILSHNKLKTIHGVERMLSLSSLWLDNNLFDDFSIISGLARLPEVSDIRLTGNPVSMASPKLFRIDFLDLFREKRMHLLPRNARLRDMKSVLPDLDKRAVTLHELRALKLRTFALTSPAAPVEAVDRSPSETGEMRPTVNTTEIRAHRPRTKRREGRRVAQFDGEPSIQRNADNDSTTKQQKKLASQPQPSFSLTDVLESIDSTPRNSEEPITGTPTDAEDPAATGDMVQDSLQCQDTRVTTALPSARGAELDVAQSLQDTDEELEYHGQNSFDDHDSPVSSSHQKGTEGSRHKLNTIQKDVDQVDHDVVQQVTTKIRVSSETRPCEMDKEQVEPDVVEQETSTALFAGASSACKSCETDEDQVEPHMVEQVASVALQPSEDNSQSQPCEPDADQVVTNAVDTTPQRGVSSENQSCQMRLSSISSSDFMLNGKSEESMDEQETSHVFSDVVSHGDVVSVQSSVGGVHNESIRYHLAEENSFYDGPESCKPLLVNEDMDLYYQIFVFPTSEESTFVSQAKGNRSLSDDLNDWKFVFQNFPRIRLWPLDRVIRDSSRESQPREKFHRVWTERVVACGTPALRRLTPHAGARYGFHGELLWSDSSASHLKPEAVLECRELVTCISSQALYFMASHDKVAEKARGTTVPRPLPNNARFRDALWPHAYARHSFSTLRSITIGFGFQRLTLRFGSSSEKCAEDYVYVLLTSSKLETVRLVKDFQNVVSEMSEHLFLDASEPALVIDNDDPLVLDALSSAVAPDVVGVVVHFQILGQRWRRGDRGIVRRVLLVSDTKLFLLDEDYGRDGSMQIDSVPEGMPVYRFVDSACLAQVEEIQASDADPRFITIVIHPLSSFQRTRNWRLCCRDRSGADRMVEDIRRALML